MAQFIFDFDILWMSVESVRATRERLNFDKSSRHFFSIEFFVVVAIEFPTAIKWMSNVCDFQMISIHLTDWQFGVMNYISN